MDQNLYNYGIPFASPKSSYRVRKDYYRQVASKKAVAKHISELHIFRNVSWKDIVALVEHCPIVHCKAEGRVITQGSVADSAMLLVEGRLRVVVESDVRNQQVGEIFPGEIFGEQGLFCDKLLRSANVIASENSICLSFSPKLMRFLKENAALPVLERQLISAMARRIRNSNLELKKSWSKNSPSSVEDSAVKGWSTVLSIFKSFTGFGRGA